MSDNTPPTRIDSLGLIMDAARELWRARQFHATLALAVAGPFTLLGLFGLFDPLYIAAMTGDRTSGTGLSLSVFLLWALGWNTPAMVIWYRLFLLGPDTALKIGFNDLVVRTIWFAGYSMLLGLAVIAVSMVILTMLGAILAAFAGGGQSVNMGVTLTVSLGVFFILASRFCLTFAGLPLGRRLPLRESWQRTQGLMVRIVGGLALGALAATIITEFAQALLQMVMMSGREIVPGAPPPPSLFIIDLVTSPLAYASAALTAGISARLYRALVKPPLDARGMEV